MIDKIYVVADEGTEFSYWTTLRLAQAALDRYRKYQLVTDLAEVQVVSLNVDGFSVYRMKGRA